MPAAAAKPAPPPARRAAAPRRRGVQIPTFALYGEAGAADPRLLHIESIASRSHLYDWEIDPHVHRGLHQILWLRAGHVDALLDDSRMAWEGPLFFAVPPGAVHAYRFAAGTEGFVLTVNATLLAERDGQDAGAALAALFAAPRGLKLEAASPEVARLHALFDALHADIGATERAAGPVPLWLTRAIVWRLAQQAERLQHATPTTLHAQASRHSLYTRWLVLLEAHYRAHWPVARYARQLGLSAERLNRLVRAETGHTAQRLIHDRLAREATRWLVHVPLPVSRLAFELGFDDPAYFCRFVKRHTGLSPRAYRQQGQRAVVV
jgi:AraC family transcriptional activator of pobA